MMQWTADLHDFYLVASVTLVLGSIFLLIFLDGRNKYRKLIREAKERDQLANELEKSKVFLRKVIDAAPSMIFVKDREGRFTLVNQAVADMYGTTVEGLIGKRDRDFNPKQEEVEHFLDHDRMVIDLEREVFIAEEKITDSDGNIHWLQTIKRPIKTARHDEPQVLGVATDISENKKLYEQLVQAQKMEAIGQLAGGVAHDFNNYLTGIMGYTSLLKISTSSPKDVEYAANMIESITKKGSQLTEKLLGFARKGKNQNISVDMHACVRETAALLNCTIEKNIKVTQMLEAPSPFIVGDPTQMQQLILNLIINARDAIRMAQGNLEQGKIKVATSTVKLLPDDYLELKAGPYFCLSVSDNGCGIEPSIIDKIFEPFFTTKDPSKGTGMGLAMAYGIVKNHHGTIKVSSRPGEGSVFTIFLPSADAGATVAPERKLSRTVSGEGHILIVDDHQIILDVTARMLAYLGYDVVTANDGVEALKYFSENLADIDLVIIDMVMPNMGAKDCYREMKRMKPDIKAILSTGYGRNGAAQEILNDGITAFVQKPYHLEKLSQVVAEVLHGGIKTGSSQHSTGMVPRYSTT